MFDVLIGLTAGIVGADRDDPDTDPGLLWKVGQVVLMVLGFAAAFVVFVLIGGFD